MKIPMSITDDQTKMKYLSRQIELLRLEHNKKGKDFEDGKISKKDFDKYLKDNFEPRIKDAFSDLNQLKEKSNLFRANKDVKDCPPALIKQLKDIKDAKNDSSFDNIKEF